MEGLAAIGLNGTLSRIEEITGALSARPSTPAATSGDAAANAFGDRLAQSAVKTLTDSAPDDDGALAAKGSYSADALPSLLSGLGAGGLSGAGSAAFPGFGGASQTTVLAAPTSLTLPAGTAVTLPGASAAQLGGAAAFPGFGAASPYGASGVAGPYTGVGVPTLPLPATANAVGGPGTAGPLGQRLAAIASAELGVAEAPKGSNDAPRIAEYRTATVGSSVAPWCAYFTSWVARQAGVPIGEGGRGEGWVPAVKEWGERTGRYIAPGTAPAQAGDLVVFDRGGDGVLDHIGVVTGVAADGSISTVEGNSSDAVSARRYGPGEYAGLVRLVPPGV
jgi:hypothetical protein